MLKYFYTNRITNYKRYINMKIQPICSNINRPIFRGNFETSDALTKIMSTASEKDLMEFSLILDVINNSNDKKHFYVKEKKPSALNPDKGFILWCQEHWDSFPKPYKSVVIENLEDNDKISQILGNFTSLLKSVYKVNFDKDIKTHFQKQIASKLVK